MIKKNINKIINIIKNDGVLKTTIRSYNHLIYITKHRSHLNEIKKNKILYDTNIDINNYELSHLKKILLPSDSNKKTNPVAVYSTYFGNNENITLQNKEITSNIPHYFISNNKLVLKNSEKIGWIPVFLELEISDNKILTALQSKIPKALPHLFKELQSYEILIYRDDKLFISNNALTKILVDFKKNNFIFAARLHTSQPRNILIEFGESMRQLRYRAQLENISSYILEKIKHGFSLQPEKFFLTGLIIRDMSKSDVLIFNENWYNEIIKCGIECQISFNFSTQQFSIVEIIDENLIHKV